MLPLVRLDSKVYNWIIFGVLSIPEYVTEEMITLAKTALSKCPLTPIYRNIVRLEEMEMEVEGGDAREVVGGERGFSIPLRSPSLPSPPSPLLSSSLPSPPLPSLLPSFPPPTLPPYDLLLVL